MPYSIRRKEGKFEVVKDDDGKVMGTHPSRGKAKAQLAALYANEGKSIKDTIKSMEDMGATEYARSECWDIQSAANALSQIAALATNELEEPQDIETLSDIMYSLLEFIRGEIDEMEASAKEGQAQEGKSVTEAPNYSVPTLTGKSPALKLDYVKSIGSAIKDAAVKYVARDEIKGYTFLWGNPQVTDVEIEYFTKDTNFWDGVLGKSPRPLTWDHAQDETFKATPVIGQITDWGDDEMGRWYVAKMDRSHKYRKMIDALIEQGVLGTSSDSAPQYVQRVKTGKATWLKEWAWFASALTDTPAEPRMIGSLEFLKSLGVALPEASGRTWKFQVERLNLLRLK